MTVINTNTGSLYAQQAMTTNARGLSNVMQQLSTGKRINNSVDDAAGLAISTRLTSQIKGLNQAIRNANDGISMIQTAEGATEQVTNMLQRMRELAVQAINDTNNSADRGYLKKEFDTLTTQINNISKWTEWNAAPLIGGSTVTPKTFNFQVGANPSQNIKITFANLSTTSTGGLKDLNGLSISSATVAGNALTKINSALNSVSSARANMGATISQLQFTADNLANISAKTQESRSRIEDTDYSQATTELAKRNIIQQAAQSMLAQANQAPQLVLQLLK